MFDDSKRRQAVAFLATVPLLEGIPEAKLEELAGILRHREVAAGEVLWREGEEAEAMLLIVDGRISVSLRLPGDRAVEVTTVGPGEVLGEVPLLDGGQHSATARVIEPTSLLSLSRADFAALVSGRHPTAFVLKRRIAGVACTRLRQQLAVLAASLGGEAAEAATGCAGRARVLPAAGQLVRPAVRDVPRLRLARSLGVPDGGPLRALPGRPHARRRGVGLERLLPDDQRCGREGDRPRRPPHPRRDSPGPGRRSGTRA